ncbi:hypothetical protein [Pseudonocardia sp. KRD291]|uniref:hypothetical protein n=1 Tax=Pseudonocardia sp. KRD291 TaxID=2792007 RepID=UPI001C4A6782|nr:hypothetical protein [Pseudonocardia sp. KRD291]MBW0101533.1 hypothetical protein [Pseudonocardia sp. KRD291]
MDSGSFSLPGRDPAPQLQGRVGDEYDPAIYRTELTGYDDGGWRLRIDAVLVAETGGPLDQDSARQWARRQMGEGVDFCNGTFSEPSRYWVANPDTRVRAVGGSS